jgi:hypothetical protein
MADKERAVIGFGLTDMLGDRDGENGPFLERCKHNPRVCNEGILDDFQTKAELEGGFRPHLSKFAVVAGIERPWMNLNLLRPFDATKFEVVSWNASAATGCMELFGGNTRVMLLRRVHLHLHSQCNMLQSQLDISVTNKATLGKEGKAERKALRMELAKLKDNPAYLGKICVKFVDLGERLDYRSTDIGI